MYVIYLNIIIEPARTSNIVMRVSRMRIASLVFGTLSYIYCGTSKLSLRTGRSRGSNPGGGEIFRTRPDRRWDPLSLLYNGYGVFPGGKAAGAWP